MRQADLEPGQRQRRQHADDQRIAQHALDQAPGVGLDARTVERQHDHRQHVVGEDHHPGQHATQRQAVVAVQAGGQRQANDPAVAAKGALGEHPAFGIWHPPHRPAPGEQEAAQGRQHEIAEQRRLQGRGEIGAKDAEKQQGRQGGLEHQGRGGVDEGFVDPAKALEQHAHEQHGEHRRGDAEGGVEQGEHGDIRTTRGAPS
ncbi:hypothetical protein D3C80_1337160 [compost metagenome]